MRYLLVIGLMLFSAQVQALELSVRAGYVDNPYEVKTNPEGSVFTALNLRHAGRTEGKSHLQYSFDVYGEKHDLALADMLDAKARLRWVARGKLFDKSASLLITGDLRAYRTTFVDQITGQISLSSSGDPLADRFSYDSAKVSMESIFRFNKQNSLALYGYVSQRDYIEDYGHLDLEALDFTEIGIQPSYRYKSESGLYLRAMVYRKQRIYDGLLNDDASGRNVSDSHVVNDMTGVGLLVRKQINEMTFFEAYLQGYQSRDNYVGARDLDYWKAEFSLTRKLSGEGLVTASYSSYDRSFKNALISRSDSELMVPGKQRRGQTFSLRYEAPLKRINKELTWFCSMEKVWVSNSDLLRSYQATTTLLGITYRW